MNPVTGISLILALIPLWQHERDKNSSATKEKFFTWLIDHNFKLLKDEIETNTSLLEELEKMLKLNQEDLLCRINIIDEKLMRVLSGMKEFKELIAHIFPPAILSENEQYILIKFVESGENELQLSITNQRTFLMAGSKMIEGFNPRFIESNLHHLAENGYIQLCSSRYYVLTESGYEYVQNLKESYS